ncbi:MAG: hypothetical protein WCG27_00635 [Pseudomonadota bacterium]
MAGAKLCYPKRMKEKYRMLRPVILIIFIFIGASTSQAVDDIYKDLISTNKQINKIIPLVGSTKGCECPVPPASEEKAWEDADFKDPKIKLIDFRLKTKPSSVVYTHEVDLSVVLLRDAGWTEEIITSSIAQTSEIYSQCGIRVGTVKLVTVTSPNKIGVAFSEKSADELEMTIPDLKKPLIFLVGWIHNINSSAFARNRTRILNEKLYDGLWVSSYVNGHDYKKLRRKEYNTIAHELAHVLGNCGHVTKGHANILRHVVGIEGVTGTVITPAQCELFKKHSSVKKI